MATLVNVYDLRTDKKPIDVLVVDVVNPNNFGTITYEGKEYSLLAGLLKCTYSIFLDMCLSHQKQTV